MPKYFTCRYCGYSVPVTENLEGLNFWWGADKTSMLQCPSCKAYTVQRAWDKFLHGEFLVVTPHIKHNRVGKKV